MRLWIKILSIGASLFILFLVVAYIFLAFQGKAIIIKQLEGLTQRKVSIGYFSPVLPLGLEIKSLNIEGLAKVESAYISPSIPNLLMGIIALNRLSIERPEITYEKNPPQKSKEQAVESPAAGTPASVAPAETTISTTAQEVKPKEKQPLRLIIKRLNIKNGKINFIDHTVGAEGIKLAVKDISINLTNLYALPVSAITNFEINGRIPWREGKEEGKISVEGWLNFYKRDIQAAVKIEDIDGVYLYPYYSQWVDLEKARIESAKLNFTSNIQGLNNNLTAECHLELTDIVRKPRAPEEEEKKAEKIAEAVLDIFRALNQGKIVLDFTIRTKMNRPEFGFGSIKNAVEDKLTKARSGSGFKPEGILLLPFKLIEGAIKGTADISKATIDGTFAVGKELKKAVEGSFTKEPKQETK